MVEIRESKPRCLWEFRAVTGCRAKEGCLERISRQTGREILPLGVGVSHYPSSPAATAMDGLLGGNSLVLVIHKKAHNYFSLIDISRSNGIF